MTSRFFNVLALPSFSALSLVLVACGSDAAPGSPPPVADTADELNARSRAPWCNTDHSADAEEGDFNGFGGRGCSDASAKASCAALGGKWCKGYVDNQILLCACKDTRADAGK